ncbi:MAG TPA: ABC transporter permease [Thermoanaerobaculia bacterium]|jgi:predicted permease
MSFILDDIWRDLRFGLRSLLRSPGFAAVAILCLALGIGANAALFSVLNAVLLRPLPFAEPDRLVRIYEQLKGRGRGSVSLPSFRDWAEQSTGFEQLAAYQMASRNLQRTGDPERIQAVEATPNLFSLLGVRPLFGRVFAAGTDGPGKARVAVVSEELWRTRLGGDPSLVGSAIRLEGVPYTVIGVMPASFDFPAGGDSTDVWLLFEPAPEMASSWDSRFLAVIGRLKPGVTLEQATTQLATVAARIEKEHPAEQTGRSVLVQPLRETLVGQVRPALLILFGAVGLVLLIACANVANLLLARAAVRQREVAIRLAVGASRARLVRQFLLESLVLSFAGTALGLLFARWSLDALAPLAKGALPVYKEFPLDGRVFGFLLVVALLSALAFGIVPALQSSRGYAQGGLTKAGGRTTEGRLQRFRSALVIVEIAVSLILLVGAGLLLRGFLTLSSTEPGLVAEKVLTGHLSVPDGQLKGSTPRLFRPALEKIRAIPGVRSAALISMLPIQNAWMNGRFVIEGRPDPQPGQEPVAELRIASPGLFQSLGIPILKGRDFTESDGEAGPPAAIVNEALVRKYFPREAPLGQRLRFSGETFTIVGVVGSVRQAGLDNDPLAEIYFPYAAPDAMESLGDAVLVIRTAVPPEGVTAGVRAAVTSVDPALPIYNVLTMQQVIEKSLAGRRLNLWLLAIFAGMALVLSAAGLYGVISYVVAQRTREIGVRIALGAQTRDVIGLVMRQGLALTSAGIVLGLLGAFAFTRVLGNLLYGVSARDPLTHVVLAAVLGMVALLATWLPARRVSRVDPILAIRAE